MVETEGTHSTINLGKVLRILTTEVLSDVEAGHHHDIADRSLSRVIPMSELYISLG